MQPGKYVDMQKEICNNSELVKDFIYLFFQNGKFKVTKNHKKIMTKNHDKK